MEHAMRCHRAVRTLCLPFVVAAAAAACATAPAAAPADAHRPPPPQTATALRGALDPRLHPPEAAVRAAQQLQPTGLELGTMWTFENPPTEYWQQRYGFVPSPQWLDHARLASVRYAEHCSASFVSPDGLVMTNHHCARQCIQDVSPPEPDFVTTGFLARTRMEERVCPDVHLDQLLDITDVTEQVRAATPAGATSQQIADAQAAAQQRIQQECAQRTGYICQVVALYQGGQYQLYQYRRFAPVKLVWAPELQAGYFGGDPDNFTYPRYALDVTFLRAYEADGTTPVNTRDFHFRWSPQGAAENDVVFVTGNPGSTSRLITVAQLMYERSYRHPFIVSLLDGQRGMLHEIAAQGPDQERAVREQLFGVENSLKAFTGQLAGLQDTLLVAQKVAWERDFRRRVEADPQARVYADVWSRMQDIQQRKLDLNPLVNLSNAALVGAPHLAIAGQLSGYLRAAGLPEEQRPAGFQGQRFDQVRAALLQPSPIPEAQAAAALALQLQLIRTWMPPHHPLLTLLLPADATPEEAARRLVHGSRIGDVAFRQLVLEAPTAADTIMDPLFRAGRMMDSIYNVVLPQWQALIAEETVQRERLGRALFAVFGTRFPPDATFTLRIADGVVSGYPYNGTLAPFRTTFYGLYARSAEFGNRFPWTLPPSFERHRADIDLGVPLNFVSTNDITGGNSGSPVLDREGRIVGIAFDGNIEQLPNEFVYRQLAGRTVNVHSAGIIEALRSVYQAQALVDELLGTPR
jgi:hypothetical protein